MTWSWSPEPVGDDAVLGLLTASALRDLMVGGLPADAVAGLADMQARARKAGHRAGFPAAEQQCVVEREQLVGRVLVDMPRDGGSWHLVDVVVHPDARRRGLARWMVTAVVRDADRAGAAMDLSAIPGAPVLDLYVALGFTPVGSDATTVRLHRPLRQP